MTYKKFIYYKSSLITLSYLYGIGHLSCNTIFLNQYREHFFNRYRSGFPIQFTEKVKNSYKKILTRFESLDLEKIDFFPTFGSDIQCLGNYTLSKSLIGIPWYFKYKNLKEIDLQEITLFRESTPNWDSRSGKSLLNSFILSDEAKNFAIIEAAFKNESFYSFFNSLIIPFSFTKGTIIFLSSYKNLIKQIGQLTYKKIRNRFFFCTILSLNLAIVLKNLNETYVTNFIESRFYRYNDAILFQGGVEYYTNVLKRNIAMKEILGKNGNKYYTHNGEIRNYFWQKKTSIRDKIVFFSNYDKEIKV